MVMASAGSGITRALTVALVCAALVLTSGCKRKRRYDGTCAEDAHCLESQRCNSGVCVRRAPLFDDKPLTAASSKPAAKAPPKPLPELPPLPAPTPAPKPAVKPAPSPRPAPPPPVDDRSPVRFRIDA
jgi:hypothetical protein